LRVSGVAEAVRSKEVFDHFRKEGSNPRYTHHPAPATSPLSCFW
jgi:hypothetical protein